MRWESHIFAGLLVVTLGVAYQTWKAEAPVARDAVTIFTAPKAVGISQVRWEKGDESVTVEVRGRSGDTLRTWIQSVAPDTKPSAPKDPHSDPHSEHNHADGDTLDDEVEESAALVARSYPGSARAAELIESFETFKALRRFDGATQSALDEMGFQSSAEVLTLSSGGKALRFKVGETAYGSDNVYLQDEAGVAYLVSASALRPLRRPEQGLLDRLLLQVSLGEVVALGLNSDGGNLTLEQRGRHDRANAYFARPDSPDERNSGYDGLVDQLQALRLKSWPVDGVSEPPITSVAGAVFVTSDYPGDPRQLPSASQLLDIPPEKRPPGIAGAIELGRASPTGDAAGWRVRSDRTERWVPIEEAAGGDLAVLWEEVLRGG